MTSDFKSILEQSIKKVEKWVEDHNYKGYEPFDGLSSFLRPLTFGNLFLDRILMQLVRQCPINLRPILGIKPLDSTIGRGYMAWGYIKMFSLTGNEAYAFKARKCLDWLIENKSPGYQEFCWGKHFDFAARGGRYPKFEPITVWTSLIGMAFLDAYEVLKERKYLEVADSICKWILNLKRSKFKNGICFSYTATGEDNCTIHNHNMLASAMLARTANYTDNKEYILIAREAMKFSCLSQHSDGSWYYGEDPMYHWIDNFHTGYNLNSLKWYIKSTGDKEFEYNMKIGLDFYKSNFFEENGKPKYYHNRTYPIDIQCASQSIDTLSTFSKYNKTCKELSLKVTKWTIENMQDKQGFFYYRIYPLGIKAKIPMLHWGQATTYFSLSLIFSKLRNGKIS